MARIQRRRLGEVGLVDGGDLSGRWRRLELVMGIFPVESLNSWNVNWFKGTGHVLGNCQRPVFSLGEYKHYVCIKKKNL